MEHRYCGEAHVYVASAVTPEDNSGPTAAVLWPYGAGGT